MDMQSRDQYLKSLVEKRGYITKSKKDKGQLLDEFCANTGLNRKHAISKIRTGQYLKPKQKQDRRSRKSTYDREVIVELNKLWELFDCACGWRLESILKDEVDHLIDLRELRCSSEVAEKLKTISARTIDEKLKPIKERRHLKNKYQKKIHPLLYQQIPVRVFAEQDRDVLGNIQTDLVEHCGQSALGPFINSVSSTHIYSGWWQGRAVMNRDQQAVSVGLDGLREEYPFVWQGIHSDNGTSFINRLFYSYCQKKKIFFSRSRPYKKNDNCLIEEKNKTHIRQLVGYRRHDTAEELEIINELYEKSADFKNFFMSSIKLIKKERIKGRIKRAYDRPLTPYQRIMKYPLLADERKRELCDRYNSLNPVKLKREIDKLTNALHEAYTQKQEKSKGRSVRFLNRSTEAVLVR